MVSIQNGCFCRQDVCVVAEGRFSDPIYLIDNLAERQPLPHQSDDLIRLLSESPVS
jgi:hypothetical protein